MAFTGNYACTTFVSGLLAGTFDFENDTFKIAVYTNDATLNASTAGYTSSGEVVASGYTAGGTTLTPVYTTGDTYVTFENVSWSAAFTARGALVYKADGGSNPAVCVLDFGADKTSTTTFTVQFPAATNTTALIRLS